MVQGYRTVHVVSAAACVCVCVSVSAIHTTVAGLRPISSSNFTICCMSLALERKKPVGQRLRFPTDASYHKCQPHTRRADYEICWFIGA